MENFADLKWNNPVKDFLLLFRAIWNQPTHYSLILKKTTLLHAFANSIWSSLEILEWTDSRPNKLLDFLSCPSIIFSFPMPVFTMLSFNYFPDHYFFKCYLQQKHLSKIFVKRIAVIVRYLDLNYIEKRPRRPKYEHFTPVWYPRIPMEQQKDSKCTSRYCKRLQ